MADQLLIVAVVAIVAVVVIREVVRWRGGRWRRQGPRGDQGRRSDVNGPE